jgi:hypothetical protein
MFIPEGGRVETVVYCESTVNKNVNMNGPGGGILATLVVTTGTGTTGTGPTTAELAAIIKPVYLSSLLTTPGLDYYSTTMVQGAQPLGCKWWFGGGTNCTGLSFGRTPAEQVTAFSCTLLDVIVKLKDTNVCICDRP